MRSFIYNLSYKLPLNWQVLLSFFRMYQIIGVEKITANSYERSFEIDNVIGFFCVTHHEPNLVLEVWTSNKDILPIIEQKVRKMFDLDFDHNVLAQFTKHHLLGSIYHEYPHLRIPGSFEVFEAAISAILSQLVSVASARKTIAKLVAKYGQKTEHPAEEEQFYLFPTPQILAEADLTNFGITKIKAKAIKELAKKVVGKEIDLKQKNSDQLKKELLKISGIGLWTVETIAMRCFDDKNSFPDKDLIIARYLKKYPDLKEFKQWRSYLAIYLWQHFLLEKDKI